MRLTGDIFDDFQAIPGFLRPKWHVRMSRYASFGRNQPQKYIENERFFNQFNEIHVRQI
jgi:hypothetical protein